LPMIAIDGLGAGHTAACHLVEANAHR
jgi:hypothetical protein